MDIEFIKTGKRGKLPDKVAMVLIARGLIRAVLPEIVPDEPKPKRQYRRRDMQAEG